MITFILVLYDSYYTRSTYTTPSISASAPSSMGTERAFRVRVRRVSSGVRRNSCGALRREAAQGLSPSK
eukprot:13046532-Heterocapsa_arctica.AAC.1